MTNIEWTDATWNPVTGCTKVSPGCAHCYAETIDHRFDHDKTGKLPWALSKERGGRGVTLHPERLGQPLQWKTPKRIFVNSMSDLFHEDVPDEFIARVWWVMGQTAGLIHERYRGHTYQILTKRPERMKEWLKGWCSPTVRKQWVESLGEIYDWMSGPKYWPDELPNVWLGVSVENQYWADRRIPLLLQTPAAIRFVSYEPALGAVDFTRIPIYRGDSPYAPEADLNCLDGYVSGMDEYHRDFSIDWLVIGGESGPKARPFHIEWARQTRDACKAADVAYFCKQLGSVWAKEQGIKQDSKGGNMEYWPDDLRVREFPEERLI